MSSESNVAERLALHNAIDRATDVAALRQALTQAVTYLEGYDMDIAGSEEIVGVDLVAKGFCQGRIYERKYRYLYALLAVKE